MNMRSHEVSLPKVIRSYSPLLIGIAVAVFDLLVTHAAQVDGLEVRKMGTIVVTAERLPPGPR